MSKGEAVDALTNEMKGEAKGKEAKKRRVSELLTIVLNSVQGLGNAPKTLLVKNVHSQPTPNNLRRHTTSDQSIEHGNSISPKPRRYSMDNNCNKVVPSGKILKGMINKSNSPLRTSQIWSKNAETSGSSSDPRTSTESVQYKEDPMKYLQPYSQNISPLRSTEDKKEDVRKSMIAIHNLNSNPNNTSNTSATSNTNNPSFTGTISPLQSIRRQKDVLEKPPDMIISELGNFSIFQKSSQNSPIPKIIVPTLISSSTSTSTSNTNSNHTSNYNSSANSNTNSNSNSNTSSLRSSFNTTGNSNSNSNLSRRISSIISDKKVRNKMTSFDSVSCPNTRPPTATRDLHFRNIGNGENAISKSVNVSGTVSPISVNSTNNNIQKIEILTLIQPDSIPLKKNPTRLYSEKTSIRLNSEKTAEKNVEKTSSRITVVPEMNSNSFQKLPRLRRPRSASTSFTTSSTTSSSMSSLRNSINNSYNNSSNNSNSNSNSSSDKILPAVRKASTTTSFTTSTLPSSSSPKSRLSFILDSETVKNGNSDGNTTPVKITNLGFSFVLEEEDEECSLPVKARIRISSLPAVLSQKHYNNNKNTSNNDNNNINNDDNNNLNNEKLEEMKFIKEVNRIRNLNSKRNFWSMAKIILKFNNTIINDVEDEKNKLNYLKNVVNKIQETYYEYLKNRLDLCWSTVLKNNCYIKNTMRPLVSTIHRTHMLYNFAFILLSLFLPLFFYFVFIFYFLILCCNFTTALYYCYHYY